jgi:D-aminoacyl-tRNA deacylase
MRALVQRVARAEVRVGGQAVGRIDRGLLVLLGVGRDDDEDVARRLARKTARLRIFEDAGGKMNASLLDGGGGALVVSQFTLYADARRGNRPGFSAAAPPDRADALYRAYAAALATEGVPVATGSFQAQMEVELVNDGPVTLMLDSDELSGRG